MRFWKSAYMIALSLMARLLCSEGEKKREANAYSGIVLPRVITRAEDGARLICAIATQAAPAEFLRSELSTHEILLASLPHFSPLTAQLALSEYALLDILAMHHSLSDIFPWLQTSVAAPAAPLPLKRPSPAPSSSSRAPQAAVNVAKAGQPSPSLALSTHGFRAHPDLLTFTPTRGDGTGQTRLVWKKRQRPDQRRVEE